MVLRFTGKWSSISKFAFGTSCNKECFLRKEEDVKNVVETREEETVQIAEKVI